MSSFTTPTVRDNSPVLIGTIAFLCALILSLAIAFGGWIAGAGIIALIVAALIVLRNVEVGFFGIVAVITTLPFATLPIDLGITPTFLDLALAAVVGVWLLGLITGQQRRVLTTPVTIPITIFLVVSIFAFIFGLSNGPLTPTLLRKFAELLLSIGFVIVVVDYCRDWRRAEQATQVLMLGGTAASGLAIGLWLLPDELANTLLNVLVRLEYPGGWVIRYIEDNPALSERAIGTSVDPNALGGLLVLLGALMVPQLLTDSPLFKRWQVFGMFGLLSLAILLTFSRGALLSLAMAIFFLAVVRYRRWLWLFAAGGVGFLLLAITGLYRVVPFFDVYLERLIQGLSFLNFNNTDLASQMRLGEIGDALTLIQRYPLFGVGFAGAPDIDIYLGVANVYLSIAQQMGILGLTAFFAVVLTLFGYAFFSRAHFRPNSRFDAIWLGYLAAVVGGLTTGLFDHYLFNTQFHHAVTAFWLLFGMAAAVTRLATAEMEIEDGDSA